MNVMFKNSLIKNAVLRSLFKNDEEEVLEEELYQVEVLSLDFLKNFSNETTLEDLLLLKNLKELSLKDFLIDNSLIELFDKLESLEELYLEFCLFDDSNLVISNDRIKIITINTCEGFYPSFLGDTKAEALFIQDDDDQKLVFDVEKLGIISNVKTLSINNYFIKNITSLNNNAPALIELDIDGSVVYEEEIKALNGNIEVSHEEEYLPIL